MTSTSPAAMRESGDRRLRCVLAIPAHNEQDTLVGCLDVVAAAPLPTGAIWDEWVLLDGGSTHRTVSRWDAWREDHPELTLRVQHSAERLGKAVELERLHRLLVARLDPELVMLVCDADAMVDISAWLHLLEPFFEDPKMAVAWDIALPQGPPKRRRGPLFQARLGVAIAQGLGPDAIRADGRLFAIRPSMLDGFSWRAELIADDTQFAGYIRAAGFPHRSVCQAVTHPVAARGWRDFYLQTYRYYARKSRVPASALYQPPVSPSDGVMARLYDRSFRVQIRAFCREAVADPEGAAVYGVARCANMVLHRFSPTTFGDAWPTSKTTKSWPQDGPQSPPAGASTSPTLLTVPIAGEAFLPPDVVVSIVTVRQPDRLARCLDSLPAAAGTLRCEVELVDNGIEPERVGELATRAGVVRVHRVEGAAGFSANHNLVLRGVIGLGRARYVLVLNDDVILEPGTIERLVEFCDERPAVGAASPALVDAEGRVPSIKLRFPTFLWEVVRRLREDSAVQRAGRPGWLSGACLLLRVSALEQVGLFDELYFLFYEDADLCRRLANFGFASEVCCEATARHESHGTVGSGEFFELAAREMRRSRRRYFNKHRGRLEAALIDFIVEAASVLDRRRKGLR